MKFRFLFKLAVTWQLELFLKLFKASGHILFPLYTHSITKCHLNRCSYTPDLQKCVCFLLKQPDCWTQTKRQSEKTAYWKEGVEYVPCLRVLCVFKDACQATADVRGGGKHLSSTSSGNFSSCR